ncbi:MAG: hypothetical protein H6719_02775 [Sandaracinaceae bacterium]|nr:hypothetical protein [Sandaracinaceae bacterium]
MKTSDLLARLRAGAGSDDGALVAELEQGPDCDDGQLARALVRTISKREIGRAKVGKKRRRDPRAPGAPEVMTAADSSFLGRLSAASRDDTAAGPNVADLEDVHVLLHILRAGTLRQRRAAASRLRARLEDGKLSNDELRSVSTTLLTSRDVEVDFEVSRACAALPGAPGREARQSRDDDRAIVEELIPAIEELWSGQRSAEPIGELPPDQRARLMVGLRDAPSVVLSHVASVLEGSDGVSSKEARHALLTSIRNSGDPRLVPTLVGFLRARHPDFIPDAARALARIDDPRVHAALASAYERSPTDHERVVLAGALALQGDVRGRGYVQKLLGVDDERVLVDAVEAMEGLATSEDCEKLIPLLERADPVLLRRVIGALGRTGDARAFSALAQLRRNRGMSSLWAEVEEAEAQLRALMELRGEEPPELEETLDLASAAQSGAAERARDPVVVRLQSWWDFVIGHFWLALGSSRRAIRRFERSAGRRPGWAIPLAALALHHARSEKPAQALAAFRRALEADKGAVEGNLYAIRVLARIFLNRAEEVEKTGRTDIARGLIEEVLSLDLRRVPNEMRFELSRRLEQLRLRGSA